jgi:hypothetical protein
MNKTYLIFDRGHHSVIYLLQAESLRAAISKYISEYCSTTTNEDGSLLEDGIFYPHVLAYIEAFYKVCGEWQIRELPEWVFQGHLVEAFCGESPDGPESLISDCRKRFSEEFPDSLAEAFVWYLKQGTLVTFYQKVQASEITILKRYLWNWSGRTLSVEDWDGDYDQILDSLNIVPIYQPAPKRPNLHKTANLANGGPITSE